MWRLPLDQTNVARARTLLRLFDRELDALTFPQQLENSPAHSASMEKVLDSPFVADEPKSLVNEEPCDCPGRHTRNPPFRTPRDIPRELSRLRAPAERDGCRRNPEPVESVQR